MTKSISTYLAFLALLLPAFVSSCSCVGPNTFRNSIEDDSTAAVKVYVRNEIFPNGPLDEAGNGFRYYRAVVLRTYRGCNLPRYERILISTGGNSALCGIQLAPRTSYLLFGFLEDETVRNRRRTVLSVGSCQYQIDFRRLRYNQRRYLARLPYQDICINNEPCDCGPVPPVAPPLDCADGSTAGFTGNCLDLGNGRCEWEYTTCPRCSRDADCSDRETFCSAGECRTIGSCGNVFDCYNPSNRYGAEIQCITQRDCVNGLCKVECCKNVVNCVADPCQTLGFQYHQCVSDYCGGCHAFAFDESGQRIR